MTKLIDEYQVVIKLEQLPYKLRLTYPTKKSGTVTLIEELDSNENIRCSCRFKGRSRFGDAVACDWLKDVKSITVGMSPKDWQYNECWIDSYYRIH